MAEYKRIQKKMPDRGVNLNCALDNVPEGQAPVLTNVRANQRGTLTTRPPLAAFINPGSTYPIHTLKRFLSSMFSGAADNLYLGTTLVDTGYSGNPLTPVAYQPQQAISPLMFIGDSVRYKKVNAAGVVYNVGIVPPGSPPSADLIQPLYSVVNDFEASTGWSAAGTAGSPSAVARVPASTTINQILYDSGSTGWALVSFTSSSTGWLQKGVRIQLSSTETAIVSEFAPAALLNTTTIAAIRYDAGTTGACCIVLATNTMQLQRNEMLLLNAEYVRVLSVATGDDNSVSFRCVTVSTHAAAETVTTYNTARMYLTLTHANGDAVEGNALTTAVTVGLGTLTLTSSLDLSQINGRPVGPNDWMHISLLVDNPANIVTVRILLDVDTVTNDFNHNYYYAEITSNLFQAASTASQTVTAAQSSAVQQSAIQEQIFALQQESALSPGAYGNSSVQQLIAQLQGQLANSEQLYTGNSQWSEVLVPISTILAGRVGSDATVSLANVKAIRIEITCSATVNVQSDSWWIGGTYGPTAPISINPESPILYHYRYRSSFTGARSNPAPLSLGGLFPESQAINVKVAYSTDPQCDTIDIARVGGSIDGSPLYIGSLANNTGGGTGTFLDTYDDNAAGDAFDLTNNVPWPAQQQPINGTCSVVGTTVFATSAAIPTTLCLGTLVLINGVATVIVGQPGANTFQVQDNLNTGMALPFQITSPTTYGNPLPYLCVYNETFFAAGDTVNPRRIYFANSGNPDGAATSGFVDLDADSTDQINGVCSYNTQIVAMLGQEFQSGTSSSGASPYAFSAMPVGCGLLTPWSFDVGSAIFFWSTQGIMATSLGPATSISKDDLYPYLPHEGEPGAPTNGYYPPVAGTIPRFAYCRNGWLYVDFLTTETQETLYLTLAFNTMTPGWWFDHYAPNATLHYQDEATGSTTVFVGGYDGSINQFGTIMNGLDLGLLGISCVVDLRAEHFGDFRARKQFGDAWVDCDASQTLAGIDWNIIADYVTIAPAANGILNGPESLNRLPLDIATGYGDYAVNNALTFSWSGLGTLFGTEQTAIVRPERAQLRATDWIDLGQSRWLQGLRVTANTGGVARTVKVQYDGYPAEGGFVTLTMNHNGDVQLPYSFAPFFAHRIRLLPTDAGTDVWEVFAVEPIGPLAPELVTNWVPQPTSFGMEGYLHIREIRPAVIGTGTVQLSFACEFGSFTLPVTLTGAYQKLYLPCPVNKGMVYSASIIGGPVRVFEADFEVVAKVWGDEGPYRVVKPWGQGQTQGAAI